MKAAFILRGVIIAFSILSITRIWWSVNDEGPLIFGLSITTEYHALQTIVI